MRLLPPIATPGHVGVSFGRHWINLALVTRRGEGFHVAAVEALPAEDRADLPAVVARMGAQGLPATFSLAEGEVRRTTLTLPPLQRRDLARVVAREAGLEATYARAWQARPAPEGGWSVDVRALPLDTLRALAQEAGAAGLSLVDVVPHAAALVDAMIRPGANLPAGTVVSLMEVWDHASILVLARDGAFLYERHIPRGFLGRAGAEPAPRPADPAPTPVATPAEADFGEILLALDEGAIESAVPPLPEPQAAPEPTPPRAAPQPGPTAEMEAEWERLAEELQRTHLFAKKNLKAGDVAQAVLAGPFAEDPAFIGWLTERMRVSVAPITEVRDDITWLGPADPRMALPIGAALSGLAAAPAHARLVPREMRRREVRPTFSYAATALLVFALASAGMAVLYEARAVARQEADVAMLRQRLAGIETEAARPQTPLPLVGPDGARRPLPPGLAAPFPGTALLEALGRAMPPHARLLEVTATWRNGAWEVTAQGEALAPPVEALAAVGELIGALDAGGRFRGVALSPVAAGAASTPFEVVLTLGGTRAPAP